MASIVSAGTTSSTALNMSADTSGVLQLASNNGTTAVTIGTDQSVTFAGSINAPNSFGFKNRIINGAMVIAQRGTGSTSVQTSTDYVSCDRWLSDASQNSKYTIQQSSDAPTGFNFSMLATSSSAYSVTASDGFRLQQRIEGFNTADLAFGSASAKTVTLSFWVKSTLTGTFGGSLCNSAFNRTYPFTYTISSASTWEQKTITIAGDTSGTWIGATNGIGIIVYFSLGAGSNFTGTNNAWNSGFYLGGSTSVVGTSGATFQISGVQLEKGSTATSFDYRPYGTELQLCQRYYYRAYPASGNSWAATGFCNNTTVATYRLMSKVTMRVAPSALEQSGTATDYAVQSSVGATTCSSVPVLDNSSPDALGFRFTVALGLVAGGGALSRAASADGYLGWSAEL